jgi:FdrA protein
MAEHVALRQGRYADSVTLMQISRNLTDAPGVQAALVAMATELNLALLPGMGFAEPAAGTANDLLIAVRAGDEESLAAAIELAERLLSAPGGSTAAAGSGGSADGGQAPRTVGAAAGRHGPGLALISVPGRHAFTDAMDALEAGCDVLVFSDNVPLWQEIALKDAAGATGLLVMGPDCGTAVVDGIGLGFAHRVAAGPVGIVAASGTGAQQVLCLLDAAGVGISAALGVGGRDLSEAVAGRSTLAALARLERDPATELIMIVSKPPWPAVEAAVRATAASLGTPTHLALLGSGQPDLTAAVELVLQALGHPVPDWPSWVDGSARPVRPGGLAGLFCGGTLCDEAMLIASAELGAIRSNIPLRPEWAMADPLSMGGNCFVDFGDDVLTRGRPHPMIDPSLREQQLARVLADPSTAAVLLDVVLGLGCHPDPAAGLLPLIEAAQVPVVVSLIGTRQDPQDLEQTGRRLHAAGATVFLSNAAAARHAVTLVRP